MPQLSTAIIRPELAAIAYEYMTDAPGRGYIGTRILPTFPVSRISAQYPIITIESLLKLQEVNRSANGGYNRSAYTFELGTYKCEEFGWEERVDNTEAALYANYFSCEEVATKRAVDIILRAQEARIAAKVFNISNLAYGAVSTEWSTAATATPIADVTAGIEAMRAASGLLPNIGACSWKVFNNMCLTANVSAVFRYSNPVEKLSHDAKKILLAQVFGLDEILVGGAIYDSAKKGQPITVADIWDDEYFGLFKVSNGGTDLREPCLGRTFLWEGLSALPLMTEQYEEKQTDANVYRVRQFPAEAFVFAGAGYLLANITA